MPRNQKLLHYGLQRSGTNYTASLLSKNFQIDWLNPSASRDHPLHKHFRLYDEKDKVGEPQFRNQLSLADFDAYLKALELSASPDGILVISKDPYSWYLSYRKWAQKCSWPQVDFHYVEEYTLFYRRWMEFARQDERIAFMRYQDLLTQGETELQRLAERWGLRYRLRRRWLGKLTSLQHVSQSQAFGEDRLRYYRDQTYLQAFTSESLRTLNQHLDPEWMAFMQYPVIEPEQLSTA